MQIWNISDPPGCTRAEKSASARQFLDNMRHPLCSGFLSVLWCVPCMTADRFLLASGNALLSWSEKHIHIWIFIQSVPRNCFSQVYTRIVWYKAAWYWPTPVKLPWHFCKIKSPIVSGVASTKCGRGQIFLLSASDKYLVWDTASRSIKRQDMPSKQIIKLGGMATLATLTPIVDGHKWVWYPLKAPARRLHYNKSGVPNLWYAYHLSLPSGMRVTSVFSQKPVLTAF